MTGLLQKRRFPTTDITDKSKMANCVPNGKFGEAFAYFYLFIFFQTSPGCFAVLSFSESSEAPLDLFRVFLFSFVDAGKVEASAATSGSQESLYFMSGNSWSNQSPYPLSSTIL